MIVDRFIKIDFTEENLLDRFIKIVDRLIRIEDRFIKIDFN